MRVVYAPGDLVFAKVKGYPAWPARITGPNVNGKHGVFFYGTYETATVKKSEIWPYNEDNKAKFGPPNLKRKGYSEGLEQIENTPEIAPAGDDLLGSAGPSKPAVKNTKAKVVSTPGSLKKPVKSGGEQVTPPSGPVVLKKPVKLSDGRPISPNKKGIKRARDDSTDLSSESQDTPQSPPPAKRISIDETPTVSRSGRTIKPKREFGTETTGTENNTDQSVKAAEKIIEEPRKVWVKLKTTGDLVEINLDKDKPERWESNHQKVQWELATARNAIKLKTQVEAGLFIPEEVIKKIENQAILSPQEEDLIKKSLALEKRKRKIIWLKTEKKLVDLDVDIKTVLNSMNPQIPKCVSLLDDLATLDVHALMLKKQPDIVTTVRKLRRYVGPEDLTGYTPEEILDINRGVKQITDRACFVYRNFMKLFKCADFAGVDDRQFPEFFQRALEKFHECTKHKTEMQILSLTEDPTQNL